MKYLLLFFFLALVLMQRGGGGRGGGGGGRSSGGGSRGFLGWRSVESAFMRQCSSDCRLKFAFNPAQLTMCIDACRSQDRWRTFKTIIGIICTICCCSCCAQIYITKKRQNRIRILKEKFMNVSTTYMTPVQFEIEKQTFLRQTWKLFYNQKSIQHQNKTLSCGLTNISPFVQNFQLQGQDQLGLWTSKGVFFCSPSGIKIWMIKDYQNKTRGGQDDSFDLLVYQGQKISNNKFQGRWYYVDHQNQDQFVGTWSLVGQNNVKHQNSFLYLKQ